jgi:hypothetical protein
MVEYGSVNRPPTARFRSSFPDPVGLESQLHQLGSIPISSRPQQRPFHPLQPASAPGAGPAACCRRISISTTAAAFATFSDSTRP